MILFVALSPGMFLSIPPVGGRWWMTGKMSLRAVFVHAAVFAVILWLAGRSGAEGFAPAVTEGSINWMLPRIRDAKSINDPNIQAIIRRIATEEAILTYDKVRKSVLPGLNTREDIEKLENAIKVVKSVPSSKVEDSAISYDLLRQKVMPELYKKFDPTALSTEILKITDLTPEGKNIDIVSRVATLTGAGPQPVANMPPSPPLYGGAVNATPIMSAQMRTGSVAGPSKPVQVMRSASVAGPSMPVQVMRSASVAGPSMPVQVMRSASVAGPSKPVQVMRSASVAGLPMPAQISTGSMSGAPSMVDAQFAAPTGFYMPQYQPPPVAPSGTGSSSFFTQYFVYPFKIAGSALGF